MEISVDRGVKNPDGYQKKVGIFKGMIAMIPPGQVPIYGEELGFY